MTRGIPVNYAKMQLVIRSGIRTKKQLMNKYNLSRQGINHRMRELKKRFGMMYTGVMDYQYIRFCYFPDEKKPSETWMKYMAEKLIDEGLYKKTANRWTRRTMEKKAALEKVEHIKDHTIIHCPFEELEVPRPLVEVAE